METVDTQKQILANVRRFDSYRANPGGSSQARKLLNDSFLRALHRVWDKHGEKVLEKMAKDHPAQFVAHMF